MAAESNLQTKIIRYLKSKGCYVIKTQAGPGVPQGCPDIFFFIDGFYGAIEVKAAKSSAFRPHQKETIERLNDWSWARVVYGGKASNWPETRSELDVLLKEY